MLEIYNPLRFLGHNGLPLDKKGKPCGKILDIFKFIVIRCGKEWWSCEHNEEERSRLISEGSRGDLEGSPTLFN